MLVFVVARSWATISVIGSDTMPLGTGHLGGRVEIGDARNLPFTIKRPPVRERLTPDVHPGGFVLGCNMTMYGDLAARIGLLDERLGPGDHVGTRKVITRPGARRL